uniref:Uncharacterized protein n=1 Tax=Pundamilia nyererei TaxID=303518 RepID=A0A3B4GVM6_9CICH
MAALSSPLRVCRGILKELRAIQGPSYKKSLAYNYVMDQFRKNKVSIPVCAQSLMLSQLLTTAHLQLLPPKKERKKESFVSLCSLERSARSSLEERSIWILL